MEDNSHLIQYEELSKRNPTGWEQIKSEEDTIDFNVPPEPKVNPKYTKAYVDKLRSYETSCKNCGEELFYPEVQNNSWSMRKECKKCSTKVIIHEQDRNGGCCSYDPIIEIKYPDGSTEDIYVPINYIKD